MKFTENLYRQLKEQGLKKTWLCENLCMRYKDFWEKAKENSFSPEEKRKIKILLNGNSVERKMLLQKARRRKYLREILSDIKP